ncbi:MAG: cytochrome c oxidase subunit II [Alphaproteobacteria bacterium]|nr:cytochrome c oxidase subunit II [Alphaproteobacteria bacterium]MDE2112633.1 cytochrome c oxidase subunit II [Alphaproteobacteria bacterium]MDE2493756.1 cytochrome c oxidase subunit II [Alphaproteobacteria bacterium]
MFLKKTAVAVAALAAILGGTGTAVAAPYDWEMDMQAAASPVMAQIEDFHQLLLIITTAICIIVAALLVWVMIRYNQRSNPVPSKTSHNTLLEVAWTGIPVIILVLIAIPSFRLLYFEADIPKPDVTFEAIGKQWFWTYAFPKDGNFQFDSYMLTAAQDKKAGEPRLLGVDNPVYVPVNKVVEVDTTGADVIHSWAVPAFGVKMDAIPGRINRTWFKATKIGTYYGECSELCGANHAFMPIEVKVVSEADYHTWLKAAKKKYAANDEPDAVRVAAK